MVYLRLYGIPFGGGGEGFLDVAVHVERGGKHPLVHVAPLERDQVPTHVREHVVVGERAAHGQH
eukprot:4113482-Pyramimonas_sp.AAC.1